MPRHNSTDVAQDSNRYFKYDAMNRQTVVDAVDAAGSLGTQGHAITYDRNGNRLADTWWGNRVAISSGQTVIAKHGASHVHQSQARRKMIRHYHSNDVVHESLPSGNAPLIFPTNNLD